MAQAWSPIGTRAQRRDFFIRGQRCVICSLFCCLLDLGLSLDIANRYSILPALSLDGILHLDVQARAYTGALFYHFIDCLLDNMNPFPRRNSVIIMDNASIHHSPGIQVLVEAR